MAGVADNPEGILQRTDLASKMSFQKQSFGASTVSDLVFVLSVYALNGTWLGFHNLTTSFQVCARSCVGYVVVRPCSPPSLSSSSAGCSREH